MKYKSESHRKTINEIKPYLKDIISNFEKSGTSKIQLTITTNFFSFRDDNDEKHVKKLKIDSMEIMVYD